MTINDVLSPESFVRVERSSRKRKEEDKEKESAPSLNTLSPNGISAPVARPVALSPNPLLDTARIAVDQKNLQGALHAYAHLIAHNRHVNDVICDLAQVAKNFPQEPQVWQVLGDALARNGEVESAQRAYSQAKKLAK